MQVADVPAADPAASKVEGAAYWTSWHEAHGDEKMEWHIAYRDVRDILAPHLERAAAAAGPQGPLVVDVGCGSSTWGTELLKEMSPAAAVPPRLMLLDAVPALIESLRRAHAGDKLVTCEAADCRNLAAVPGLEAGAASVVLDKGTLDALPETEDLEAMVRGVASLLSRPTGIFVSVSFATAKRVFFLRRVAADLGLYLALRVVPALGLEREVRLVALLAESFGGKLQGWDGEDSLTRQHLDHMLFSGPQREQRLIRFSHAALQGGIVQVEQDRPASRIGTNEDATGAVVWPAAHSLAAHLCQHPELVRGRRVVELGAGAGLVGLVAAALGATDVVLTDLPSGMALLHGNVERNAAACGGRVRAAELRWGAELEPSMEGCEVVIGCEIVYQHDEDTFAALVETMRQLASRSGVCLIAYEFRDGMIADLEFFDRANDLFEVEIVSLGPYGFGVPEGQDDQSRLLYLYRPKSSALGTGD